MTSRSVRVIVRATALSLLVFVLLLSVACRRGGKIIGKEYAYVSATQVNLRDRLSAVYNKVGVVPNGTRVEVLEKNRRFCRVKAEGFGEGWVEMRYLADQETFDGFEKLATDNASAIVVSRGVTRAELNMHLTAARDGARLYQLKEGDKVEVLQRTVTDKNLKLLEAYKKQVQRIQQRAAEAQATDANGQSKPTTGAAAPLPVATAKPSTARPVSAASKPSALKLPDPPPSILEDWWLVRDAQKRVGWVLARMVDVDIPLEIAQYAEGQRIVSSFILNTVNDVNPDTGQTRAMPQYLVLTTEPKDGQPFDYNHIRVFSWNRARHRYETAYRERNLFGVFPASVGHAVFDKEGDLPTFTIHVKDDTGQTIKKTYKMNGPIVRRVLSPEEEAAQKQALAQKLAERKAARDAALARYRASHPAKAKPRSRRTTR
ncbi:MAG TPA: SH3 domain-containing protein [Terriglobales bacterium]|nr:SH3 domain-containing protein [Terriglobales bacterium]